MGKARILNSHGAGLYDIEILEDRGRAESLKQRALERIDEIDSELDALEADLDQAQQDVDAAAIAQNQAIDEHQAQIIASGESDVDLQAPALAVLEAAAARDSIRTRIASLNLERLGRQGWVDRIEALPELRARQAWCADLTENLSGEVATAEVPGEVGQVIIKPGFHDSSSWSPSEDGAMQPALAGTPAGVFYNLAMMPGWQRWRPTFRIATINSLNNDLCDITLDAAFSSQQNLNVNAQSSYSSVPIYYMDCNSDAFEVGDRVLVAFSGNTEQPMVVGFESNPQDCCSCVPHVIASSPTSGTWDVKDLYGSTPISACPEDEWRILNKTSDEVEYSGTLRQEPGGLYLDGLPEDPLDARPSETLVDGPTHCDHTEDVEIWISFPPPDPVYWGGTWWSSYMGTGPISETGQYLEWAGGPTFNDWLVIWTVGDCFTFTFGVTANSQNYELQLGCKQPDETIEWPE